MRPAAEPTRNPGPNWGYGFLLWAERWWPSWIFRPAFKAGTWVGLAFMPAQRGHSRDFLRLVFNRPPTLVEIWRHFFAFADSLMFKLRVGRTGRIHTTLDPGNAAEFEALLHSEEPALFGTFHFGCSDLLGYLLGSRGKKVSIIRLKVGNSTDTRLLGERFGGQATFLWINEPADLLFKLKEAIESGQSLAMKCDRVEFSGKVEPFQFLGAQRLFPFTIYHLGILFHRPVVFCTAVPGAGADEIQVFASPVFAPDSAAGREANLVAARAHFQAVLVELESLVRKHPLFWFNFLPLNPVAAPSDP